MDDGFFSGYDPHLQRPVSIRPIPERIKSNPVALQSYLAVSKRCARLNHPNILAIYDVDETRLVTESVQGTRLLEFLQTGPNDRRAFTHSFQAQLLPQLVAGLNYAHEYGLVHQCLTPANIWLFPHDQLKLWGFGLAFLELSQNISSPLQEVPQACHFMSPEQSRGEKVDRRSDIWSLGVLLYLLESGQYPFPARYLPELICQILTSEPVPCPGVSEMVMRCLQKDPAHRFQTARSILDEPDPFDFPRVPEALMHHVLACNYYRQGKYVLAVLEWTQASQVDPYQPVYINNLGAAHFKCEELDAAQRCFEGSRSHYNLGLLLHHQAHFQEAGQSLSKATYDHPGMSAVYLLLGECLLKRNKLPQAIEELQKCLILQPQNPRCLRVLGQIYQALGRAEEAESYREKADELGPDQSMEPLILGLDWTVEI